MVTVVINSISNFRKLIIDSCTSWELYFHLIQHRQHDPEVKSNLLDASLVCQHACAIKICRYPRLHINEIRRFRTKMVGVLHLADMKARCATPRLHVSKFSSRYLNRLINSASGSFSLMSYWEDHVRAILKLHAVDVRGWLKRAPGAWTAASGSVGLTRMSAKGHRGVGLPASHTGMGLSLCSQVHSSFALVL